MKSDPISPNKDIASAVVTSMTNEKVLSSIRMKTGEQYYVFDIKTTESEYVIRMTDLNHKNNFISAIYWQEKLIPLGVPLAKFMRSDLDGKYSQYPALLMPRLQGTDLCNIYSNFTDLDKKNLAKEIAEIQSLTNQLPDGAGCGISASYEQKPENNSWYDFLVNRLFLFRDIIKQNGVFSEHDVNKVISIAKCMEDDLHSIRARPFLWDASERNVIVHNGKITGIVDVDDICFGDPLFVIALTHVALEMEGHDTLYADYWAEELHLDKNAQHRLEFYRLFYAVVFMRKHSMRTTNSQKIYFNVPKLQDIFNKSLQRIMASF
jgi:fructosamine-3-kinase